MSFFLPTDAIQATFLRSSVSSLVTTVIEELAHSSYKKYTLYKVDSGPIGEYNRTTLWTDYCGDSNRFWSNWEV